MPQSRLPAKIIRPRLFDAAHRTRLFDLLDAHSDRPLVWVSGPPGSGKTTLLGGYLAHAKVPTLWYRLDEGDNDPASFFNYLTLAARALSRKRKVSLPALTPEYLPDLPGFFRRYFRRLYEVLPRGSALVLDAYEAVSGTSIDALMSIAVAEAPCGYRVLVTSREEPPAGLTHFETKGLLFAVTWSDLRLSAAEAQAIALSTTGRVDAAERLREISDGWVAGFVVLLDHVRRSGATALDAFGTARESMFAYFVNEMFSQAGASLRAMLTKTAVMPGFTAAQAQALCPEADAPGLLERLYRRHYFLDRDTGAKPVYRYHALFREFLLEQGRQLLRADEQRTLAEQAACLLEAADRKEEAFDLYVAAQAWSQAARVIAELAPGWLGQGRNAVLVNAIGALPQAMSETMPWLAYWLGVAKAPFDMVGSRQLLERAYDVFEAAADYTGCVLACAGVLETYLFGWSDMRPIDRWGVVFERLERDGHVAVSRDVEIRALSALTVLHFRGDLHRPLLARANSRALDLLPFADDAVQRVALGFFCGLSCVAYGQWAELRSLVESVDAMLSGEEGPPMQRLTWDTVRMWQAHQSGSFDAATAMADRSEALSHSVGIRVLDLFNAGHGAYAALNTADVARVERYLERMRVALHPACVLDAANYDTASAGLALMRGDADLAVRTARMALGKTDTCGATLSRAQAGIALVHALIEKGQHAAALEEIEWIARFAQASEAAAPSHRGVIHTALILRARALHGLGRVEEAHITLRTALTLAREANIVVVFPWAPVRFMQRVYGMALEAGIEREFVRGLIRRINLPVPPNAGEHWPWPVRIRVLGRFEIEVDGVSIEYRRKLPKRPLALLKWLLARRDEARVEHAIDALWPDEEADAASNALDAALHRLRRLLGGSHAAELQDGRLKLNRSLVWVDAIAFEQALDVGEAGDVRAYELALRLYRGHLLAGDRDEPWSISTRERLRSRYVRAVATRSAALHAAADHDAVVALFAQAIDIDDTVETFYQGLMESLLAMAKRSEGLAVYDRLQRALAQHFDLKPSAVSERLHLALRSL